MNKTPSKKLFILCNLSLIAAAMISGLSFVAQKLGMTYVGPFTFNTLRCFIGSLCLIPIIFMFSILTPDSSQYCMIYAQAGKAGFITSLYILFVPVIAVFLKHKLGTNVKISIAAALFGMYLLCAKGAMSFDMWDIFLLLSAFFFALHIVVVSHYSKKANALKLSGVQFLTAGILSLPFMFIFEEPSLSAIISGYKPILFIGVVVTGVAYTLQIFGHKATHPVLATLILSSEAVFAVIGGMLILHETLTMREITGCVIMAAAIILSQIRIKRFNTNNIKEISNEKTNKEPII